MNRSKIPFWLKEITVLLLLSLVSFFWLKGTQVILGHDSGFRLNFVEYLKSHYYSWNPVLNFGTDWTLYRGFMVAQAPETFFSMLFSSLSIGQRFAFVYWFFGIGLSAYLFAVYFFPEQKYRALRIIFPTLYMYNFYILNAWTIFERAKFSLYIALPLMILLFFKTVRKEYSFVKGGMLFGLLFFFFNGGGAPPLYGAILVAFGLLALYFFISAPKRNTLTLFQTLVAFGICAFLLNAYWILPQYGLIRSTYTQAVANHGGFDGLIAWENVISKDASIPNIVRLQGLPDWYNNPEHPYSNIYISSPVLTLLSWMPFIAAIFGIYALWKGLATQKQKSILFFLLILGSVGLFFTEGSHEPFGVVYVYFMRHIPGFGIFRSAFYKFAPTVYLSLMVFAGYATSLILERINSRKVVLFITCGITLGIVLYHFPYLTGNFFALKGGFSTRVTVPEYVNDMMTYVNTKTDPKARILLAPSMDTGYINSPIDTYTWGYYSLDLLPTISMNRSIVANDSSDNSTMRLLYTSIGEDNEDAFNRIAQQAGIQYVLWRGDVKFTSDTEKRFSVALWESKIRGFHSLSLVHDSGVWKLYAINKPAMPLVYAPKHIVLVQTPAPDDAYIVGRPQANLSEGVIRISDSSLENYLPLADELFIEAECYSCKTNEYTKLVDSIALPPLRHLPGFLTKLGIGVSRVQLNILTGLSNGQKVDARLSIIANLLSETVDPQYHGLDNQATIVSQVNATVDDVSHLSAREADIYANRVTAYFAAYLREIEKMSDLSSVSSIKQSLEHASELLQPYTWMGDGAGVYRLGVSVWQSGMYSIYVPDSSAYDQTILVDNVPTLISSPISLSAGYHRVVINVHSTKDTADQIFSPVFFHTQFVQKNYSPPSVSFSEIDPTRFDVTVSHASSPYVLVVNNRFDGEWVSSAKVISHNEVNDFANGWLLPKSESNTLSFYYLIQQYAYLGDKITLVMLSLAVAYGIYELNRMRKKKK